MENGRKHETNEAVHMWIQDAVGLHDGEEEKTQISRPSGMAKAILEQEEQETSQKKR